MLDGKLSLLIFIVIAKQAKAGRCKEEKKLFAIENLSSAFRNIAIGERTSEFRWWRKERISAVDTC